VEISIDDGGKNTTSILNHKIITGGERTWCGKCVPHEASVVVLRFCTITQQTLVLTKV
jgi:hypothetical protein